jgi:predicted alpha/beta-hydrolase family hydrolase
MSISHTLINGSRVSHLGSLKASHLLVVVGRSNYKKSSASLEKMLHALHAQGLTVCWFESGHTQTAKQLDDTFEKWGTRWHRGGLAACCRRHGAMGAAVRKLCKGLILLMQPGQWDYFIFRNSNLAQAADLRRFLGQLAAPEVTLFSHSAGGIVSSLVADEPSVRRVVCFGYPFKHPEKNEEPHRTAHLATLRQPMLIFQGDRDDYGTAQDAKRYQLSTQVT